MTVKEALQSVIGEATGGFADYAKTYAQAGLDLGGATDAVVVTSDAVPMVGVCMKKTGNMMVGEELRVQILYVLSNLAGWKGERAREVKAVLKAATKGA